jgi:hypothetical protein
MSYKGQVKTNVSQLELVLCCTKMCLITTDKDETRFGTKQQNSVYCIVKFGNRNTFPFSVISTCNLLICKKCSVTVSELLFYLHKEKFNKI